MKLIDEYFLKDSERLFYLNLKEDNLNIGLDMEEIPLPLLRDDFMEQLKSGEFHESVDFSFFIKGMIYNISIDPEFKYFQEYKKILKSVTKDLGSFIFLEGIKKLSENDDDAVHYFRANYLLETGDSNNNYYYSIVLNKLAYNIDEKYGNNFLIESDKILNEIIKTDENYPMSYYALGNIEVADNNFIKANSYYKEALRLLDKYDMPEGAKKGVEKEIKEKIHNIEIDIELSEGLQLLQKGDFYGANKKLMALDEKVESGIVKYYIGLNLMQAQEKDLAYEYILKSKELGYDELNLFIDLSYLQALFGQFKESIETITEGLDKYNDDENLLYNRAMIYANMGQFEKAIEDLDTLISYDDITDDMYNKAMILKEKLN